MLEPMDPSPLPKNRVLTSEELKARSKNMSNEESKEAQSLLDLFTNSLIDTSVKLLDAKVFAEWQGSVVTDATVVPAFARGPRIPAVLESADPDAACYIRTADHRDFADAPQNPAKAGKGVWGFEATIIAMMTDDPGEAYQLFPRLILTPNMNRPSTEVAETTMRGVDELARRKYPAKYFIADRGILPNSKSEQLQVPLRLLG